MIHGGYWSIALKDGRTANADLLECYRGFLGYMSRTHSKMFNEACRSVLQGADDAAEKLAALKTQKNLDIAHFKMQGVNTPVSDSIARTRVLWGDRLEEYFYRGHNRELDEKQIKAAIELCAEPTLLSRIFRSVASDKPLSYKVTDPVKDGAKPTMCEYMWIGQEANNVFERNIIV